MTEKTINTIRLLEFLQDDVAKLEKNFEYVEQWVRDRVGTDKENKLVMKKLEEMENFIIYWDNTSKHAPERLGEVLTFYENDKLKGQRTRAPSKKYSPTGKVNVRKMF